MNWWRVIFGPSESVLVQAETPEGASLKARIDLWLLLDRWLDVVSVEAA